MIDKFVFIVVNILLLNVYLFSNIFNAVGFCWE